MPGTVAFMVVMIVLITTVGRILNSRYKAMEKLRGGEVHSADQMRQADEIRQLKDRIAVLERVITDNHSSLSLDRQIEQLRDR
jgi:signal transduction histidine kinase